MRYNGPMTILYRLIARLYGWACERLYHELAWAYDWVAWGVSRGAWAAWRRVALTYVQGRRVLELGVGTGHLVLEAQRRGLAIIGLDLSPNMLAVAQRHVGAGGGTVPLLRARAQQLPLADQSVDTIIATFPAAYILSPVTLRECARVLHGPDGRLVIVGLWVQPDWVRRFPLPFLYGTPSEGLLQRVHERLIEAGFEAPVIRSVGSAGAQVGVLIAQRSHPDPPHPQLRDVRNARV